MFITIITIVRWEGGEQYCELESKRFQKYCSQSLLILSHVFLCLKLQSQHLPLRVRGICPTVTCPSGGTQLSCADFEVHQNVAEPAFNPHDRKGTQQQHSRPQKQSLTLPLTPSIMLCSNANKEGTRVLVRTDSRCTSYQAHKLNKY